MNNNPPEKIKKMFDEIAPKYDFMNNVISFGLHKLIKKSAVNKLDLKNGAKVLDLCCGTGDISKLLADKKEVEKVIGVDFSLKMLELSAIKNSHKKIEYINADCLNLPFEDNSFDAVTIFFGLRNIPDKEKAINEIYRVLKPEGQVLHLDFQNGNRFFDFLFNFFAPLFAKIFTKTSDAYKYLVKTKQRFYKPDELKEVFALHNLNEKAEYSFLFSTISAQVFIKK